MEIAPKPAVGMMATLCYVDDRYPYQIVEVINEKKIIVQRMDYKRIDNNGLSEMQTYEFFPPKETTEMEIFTLRRNGKWISEKNKVTKKAGCYLALGEAQCYSNPSL